MTMDIVFLFYTSFYQELADVKRERERKREREKRRERKSKRGLRLELRGEDNFFYL